MVLNLRKFDNYWYGRHPNARVGEETGRAEEEAGKSGEETGKIGKKAGKAGRAGREVGASGGYNNRNLSQKLLPFSRSTSILAPTVN